MRPRFATAAATLLALGVLAAGCGTTRPVEIQITVHYSKFEPSAVSVPSGVPVTFVLVNADPIDHEWLIGDPDFHQRHRTGTDAQHGARPNEISVPALASESTTLTFEEPGELAFICHLPGHETYGMVGKLTVL
ncbi:MAG TPA: cupredoxin domain-containing protein [Candidatus Limnocylindria bacterium]|nr:cupredoxin domain-containing protein [Candidatus Limnocylindria bacterium]